MVEVVADCVVCRNCLAPLVYDKEDTFRAYNTEHTKINKYIKCPICDKNVFINHLISVL